MKYKIKNKQLKELISLTGASEAEMIRCLIADKLTEEQMVGIINESILQGLMTEIQLQDPSDVPMTKEELLRRITEMEKSSKRKKKPFKMLSTIKSYLRGETNGK